MTFQTFTFKSRCLRSTAFLSTVALSFIACTSPNLSAAEIDITSLFGPDLTPYALQYEARYDGFKASASKTLSSNESGTYQLNSFIEMKILFQTVSSINENSIFDVSSAGEITPQTYTFEQKGLGSRERSQIFDLEQEMFSATLDGNTYDISFSGNIQDSLTAMLYLREQVSVGLTDISFLIADKAEAEEHRYKVGSTELIETPLGEFNAIRVERVREPSSPRETTLWLLPDYGYVMVAFEQINDDDEKLELHLSEGMYGESAIVAPE